MATQVVMPQLGESVVEGTVGHWLVAEGQQVRQYDPLLAVTTDKVDTEISAPASGTLLKIYVPEGQTVAAGTVLALIGAADEVAPGEAPPSSGGHHTQPSSVGPAPTTTIADEAPLETPAQGSPDATAALPTATPVAQRVALEHGIDLTVVTGTGPGGRITKEDVEAHLAGDTPGGQEVARPAPARETSAAGGPEAAQRPMGFISPAVARLAAEYNVDLTRVRGTGEGGRVTKKDLLAFVAVRQSAPAAAPAPAAQATELPPWEQPGTGSLFKPTEEQGVERPPEAVVPPAARPAPAQATAPAPAPTVRAQAGGEDEVQPLSAIRRSIARHMLLSKQTSPHVTTVMEADLTRVVQARERLKGEFERQGARLTFTPFFVQAIVAGLRAVPEANSSFSDDSLVMHRRVHVGMAVAIADGLIVPVIRDADEKSLLGLARAVNDLAERGRSKRLAADEVQGGTFTLTNHGTAGSLFATPIINQPQAGILGVGAIQKRPVVISQSSSLLPGPDDFIAIRPMAYLSFTFDHRILDGAGADGFLSAVQAFLEHYAV